MAITNLYVTEVTQKSTANGEVVIIAHGTDNAANKSTINADVLPKELLEMFGVLNAHFKTICDFGRDINYAITGFKIRDAKSGNQEVQFSVNIRTNLTAFDDAKTAWLEIRETDLATLQGGSFEVRERVRAVNGIIEQFNELQSFVRDNIADWLEMVDTPKKQLSMFDQEPPKSPKAFEKGFLNRNESVDNFHESLRVFEKEHGVKVTASVGAR